MSITHLNTLIPYFTTYLIHHFYNLKTKCDRKKTIAFLKSAWKITSIETTKKLCENKQPIPVIVQKNIH